MIIVGTYPNGFEARDGMLPLTYLKDILLKILPAEICLHLLPFNPSSGDFGFAPDDWFGVSKDLGDWSDIKSLAENWRLIVDGIYNHVGRNHRWFTDFIREPESHKHLFYTFKNVEQNEGPLSPRGQPVLQKLLPDFFLWQTFNEFAIDIRIQDPVVQSEIDEHIKLLKSVGTWGVRLDAVAYYAKALGKTVRHNSGGTQLAELLAEMVEAHNLHVIAQLDCDKDGLSYYADRNKEKQVPINDFPYSTYLALGLIDECPDVLIKHINNTDKAKRILIRAPRTHDGILLRSKLFDPVDVNRIIKFARENDIPVNITNDIPYEINCSAPYLYSKIVPGLPLLDLILFTSAVTGMISGWSYFYLPYLVGFIPEYLEHPNLLPDPRAINRVPIDLETINRYLKADQLEEAKQLMLTLQEIHQTQGFNFISEVNSSGSLISLTTIDDQFRLIGNFSHTSDMIIEDNWETMEVLCSKRFTAGLLGKLGFVIFKIKNPGI